MKTASTFHSDFTNSQALLVDGVPHLSITGATKLMYGAAGGSSLASLRSQLMKIAGHTKPVAAADLSFLDGILPVTVKATEGKREQLALAMTQELFIQMLWHFSEKNTTGGKRAKLLLKGMAGVGLDMILKKEAGLLSDEGAKEVDESVAKFFKPLPGNEKAGSINRLKELLIANGQKDRCARMGILINELVYNRLPVAVYEELINRSGQRRGFLDHTKWQYLDPSTQQRIDDIIVVAEMLIRKEMQTGQIFNFAPIILDLDQVMPRQRHSGYAPLEIQPSTK